MSTEFTAEQSDFLKSLGAGPTETAVETPAETEVETPATETPVVEETPPTEEVPPEDGDTTPAEPAEPAEPAKPDFTQTFVQPKDNKAFADMRVQNKAYSKMVKGLAGALKIEGNFTDAELADQIGTMVTDLQAKQTNIPTDILQRLQAAEASNDAFQKATRETNTVTGLVSVQEEFGVTDEIMDAFCKDLKSSDLNPLLQDVDLRAEFISRNWKPIQEAAVANAIKAEQERAIKAGTQSSTPSGGGGNPTTPGGTKINTVHDLDTYFNSIEK